MKGLNAALISAMLVVAIGSTARSASTPINVNAFADASYIYIATIRKDGSQSRAVPVWFVTTAQGRILIDTNTDSWKAKRVRRGSPVIVWMGSRTGPAFIGKAEFETDSSVQDQMIERIPQKYLLARFGLFGPKRANFDSGKIVTIRITPERGLPAGFKSQPGAPPPALL